MRNRKYLFVILVLMAVGFAAVSTTLYLTGNTSISVGDFDVYFSKAIIDGENKSSEVIDNISRKTITYTSKDLKSLNETSELVYTVKNGSINYDANVIVSCNTESNEYVVVEPSNNAFTIPAGRTMNGTLTAKVIKVAEEEKEFNVSCELIVNAIEKDTLGYILTGTYVDEDGKPLANKNFVVYSETPHYVVSDSKGKITVAGLEDGSHEIYLIDEPLTNIYNYSKNEVISKATLSTTFSINDEIISFLDGSEIKNVDYDTVFDNQGNLTLDKNIVADSLLEAIEEEDYITGYYDIKITGVDSDGKKETIIYPVHIINIKGDTVLTENTSYGDLSDCASGTTESDMAKNMVIVKVNGDLTINEEVTVGPVYHELYGGPKGFMLYVTGTLTNNGTIDNSHGAYANGENVYLWKNDDDSYEYIPLTGSAGGAGAVAGSWNNTNGTVGNNGTSRSTAGGGSGYANGGPYCDYKYSSVGGTGTSYSGGTGGAGNNCTAPTPSNNLGGEATGTYPGAGNPTGGTGGLLIIYANNYINNGIIQANGSINNAKGGGSGGGSINIFTNIIATSLGTVTVNGGVTGSNGGSGGNGSISIGSISTGTYVSN